MSFRSSQPHAPWAWTFERAAPLLLVGGWFWLFAWQMPIYGFDDVIVYGDALREALRQGWLQLFQRLFIEDQYRVMEILKRLMMEWNPVSVRVSLALFGVALMGVTAFYVHGRLPFLSRSHYGTDLRVFLLVFLGFIATDRYFLLNGAWLSGGMNHLGASVLFLVCWIPFYLLLLGRNSLAGPFWAIVALPVSLFVNLNMETTMLTTMGWALAVVLLAWKRGGVPGWSIAYLAGGVFAFVIMLGSDFRTSTTSASKGELLTMMGTHLYKLPIGILEFFYYDLGLLGLVLLLVLPVMWRDWKAGDRRLGYVYLGFWSSLFIVQIVLFGVGTSRYNLFPTLLFVILCVQFLERLRIEPATLRSRLVTGAISLALLIGSVGQASVWMADLEKLVRWGRQRDTSLFLVRQTLSEGGTPVVSAGDAYLLLVNYPLKKVCPLEESRLAFESPDLLEQTNADIRRWFQIPRGKIRVRRDDR